MREIKFRAWDKNLKIMLNKKHWLKIEFFKNHWHWVWRDRIKWDEHLTPWSWSAHRFTSKEILLMQYTWLKDKNWKEIYEGDIVKYKWENLLVEYITDLSWDYWWSEHPWFYFKFSYDTDDWHELCYHTPLNKECEIKWNIYENPELLD